MSFFHNNSGNAVSSWAAHSSGESPPLSPLQAMINIGGLSWFYQNADFTPRAPLNEPITFWGEASGNNIDLTPDNFVVGEVFPSPAIKASGSETEPAFVSALDGKTGCTLYYVCYKGAIATTGRFFNVGGGSDGVKLRTGSQRFIADVYTDAGSAVITGDNTNVNFSDHLAIIELLVDLTLGSLEGTLWNHEFSSSGVWVESHAGTDNIPGSTINVATTGLIFGQEIDTNIGTFSHAGFDKILNTTQRNIALTAIMDDLGFTGLLVS